MDRIPSCVLTSGRPELSLVQYETTRGTGDAQIFSPGPLNMVCVPDIKRRTE